MAGIMTIRAASSAPSQATIGSSSGRISAEAEKWTVYWDNYAADTYLYGSELTFHAGGEVEFLNPLMPPGTVIRQWYSKTNYQAQKIEPQLPILDGGAVYGIWLDAAYPDAGKKEGACMLRLLFQDRYGEETGSEILRGREKIFRCPEGTYSYRMQLINGGTGHFIFRRVVIWEILDEKQEA